LSDTYTKIYEQKTKAKFAEQVLLILDLEQLMIWNRSKTGKNYLVYAEIIEEEDKVDDMDVGIGQKVTKVSEKISKITKNSKTAQDEMMKTMQTM
jgi:hypothetical protein